jgi:hypothetical protein
MLFAAGAERIHADLFAPGDQSTDHATVPVLGAVDEVFALMADDVQGGADDCAMTDR